jgi:hypothetical protein
MFASPMSINGRYHLEKGRSALPSLGRHSGATRISHFRLLPICSAWTCTTNSMVPCSARIPNPVGDYLFNRGGWRGWGILAEGGITRSQSQISHKDSGFLRRGSRGQTQRTTSTSWRRCAGRSRLAPRPGFPPILKPRTPLEGFIEQELARVRLPSTRDRQGVGGDPDLRSESRPTVLTYNHPSQA